MTGETVTSLVLAAKPHPHVGLGVRVSYVCGHSKRVILPHPYALPPSLLRCECGGRWQWIAEDVE